MSHPEPHWSELTHSPAGPVAQRLLRAHLDAKWCGLVDDASAFLLERATGNTVLDIGFVANLERMRRGGWKHRDLQQVASRLVGIDIHEAGVEVAREEGYDARVVDCTSSEFLGERFDVVHMGDVIEHLDKPVAALKFAKRHLSESGQVIVTTPNALSYQNIRSALNRRTVLSCADHVSWISPSHALELGYRAGLGLDGYWGQRPGGGRSLRHKLLYPLLRSIFQRRATELVANSFIFVYS